MGNEIEPRENDRAVKEYVAHDGMSIKLTPNILRKFFVAGKPDVVASASDEELIVVMGICQSRGLNPFTKDCYLIKYSVTAPVTMITSIDFFRSRSRAKPDCVGWKKGPIVQTADGEIKYTNGLVLKGETLVGGWAEATPTGWPEPMKLEVNLETYRKDNDFWRGPKSSHMIAKVAESQILRMVWPDDFGGLFTEEESGAVIDVTPTEARTNENMDALKGQIKAAEDKQAGPPADQNEGSPGSDTPPIDQGCGPDQRKPDFHKHTTQQRSTIEALCEAAGIEKASIFIKKYTYSGKGYWQDLSFDGALAALEELKPEPEGQPTNQPQESMSSILADCISVGQKIGLDVEDGFVKRHGKPLTQAGRSEAEKYLDDLRGMLEDQNELAGQQSQNPAVDMEWPQDFKDYCESITPGGFEIALRLAEADKVDSPSTMAGFIYKCKQPGFDEKLAAAR